MKHTCHDLSGQRFSNLTAIERVSRNRSGQSVWFCRCDCGQGAIASITNLRLGRVRSCGCLMGRWTQHADTRLGKIAREYHSWRSIKQRCCNPRSKDYQRYGAVGVTMCQRWKDSYEAFLTDMGRKPSPAHTVDRINPHGDYTPENCRWATPLEQRHNRRTKS